MANSITYSSSSSIILPEYRTKWERIWPKSDENVVALTKDTQALVRSRVQRYSVRDDEQFTKQVGFVNTVNTAKFYSDTEQPYLWVVHNVIAPSKIVQNKKPKELFTTTTFIQPSVNK